MNLRRRVPEQLRPMLAASEEAAIGRHPVTSESERERDLHLVSGGRQALAREGERLEIANAGGQELRGICRRIVAFEHDHGWPLPSGQGISDVTAEGEAAHPVIRDQMRTSDRHKLKKEPRKLHDPVVGAPGMLVALADTEAEPLEPASGGIEVVHADNEMIEAAWRHDSNP